MTAASANLEDLYFVKETTYGITPTNSTAWETFRKTGESLRPAVESTASAEIRSDRQTADLVQTSFDASGPVNIEFSYGSFDSLLPGVFGSAGWATSSLATVTATDISFANADNSINSAGSGFGSFAVGDIIRITGSTSNDGIAVVVTATSAKLTLTGIAIVDESAGDSITVEEGENIRNGGTLSSYSIEKKFTDTSPVLHETFTGMVADTLDLQVSPQQILTGSFGFSGKASGGLSATSAVGSGSVAAATATDVLNAISNVEAFIGGVKSTLVTNLQLQIANNLRSRQVVGVRGAQSVALGSFGLTGSITFLLESVGEYAKLINFQDSDLLLKFTDGDGNAYGLFCPRIKYSAGGTSNPGQNQDIPVELSFQAILGRSTGLAYTASLYRWAA
jgi:hypothetical protein